MSTQVVVLGAGYAGAGTVTSFEAAAAEAGLEDVSLTWVSEHEYHLVLHEVHRAIRDPDVEASVTIPVDDIAAPDTRFRQGRVDAVDTDREVVVLEDGEDVEYDYLLIALGSATAFYGIEGLREHSLTLKGLEDAIDIHEAVLEAAAEATPSEPAEVVVGGAGLSGIQAAGEIAELRDRSSAAINIRLVEGLDEVFPGNDPEIQAALRERLEDAGVDIHTGEFISEVDGEHIALGGGEDADPEMLPYDVLVWTGGITGQPELRDADVEKDDRSNRIYADSDFRTSADRVFAIGDTALVDQGRDQVAPPTAQAAWQAAEVAGRNLVRAIEGDVLERWRHRDKGTVVSVGERAVAHDVEGIPVRTFGGLAARLLKKGIAARWIASVSSTWRALRAWGDM